MEAVQNIEIDRVRGMAESLDCFIEEDFQQLAGATALTVEAWRKRHKGPAYILLGNRYLYPRRAVADYLKTITREHTRLGASVL